MSLKINEMRKCHPHQGFWRRGEVGDFALREAGKANPSGLSHAVAIRYKGSGPSEPKAVILRGIYWLQLKSARFSVNLNANRASDQGFGAWNPSMLPPMPRLSRLAQSDLVLLFVNTVTYSCHARPVRAGIVWPTATSRGVGAEPMERSPARGGIAPRKYLMSPLAGLLKQETISHPAPWRWATLWRP